MPDDDNLPKAVLTESERRIRDSLRLDDVVFRVAKLEVVRDNDRSLLDRAIVSMEGMWAFLRGDTNDPSDRGRLGEMQDGQTRIESRVAEGFSMINARLDQQDVRSEQVRQTLAAKREGMLSRRATYFVGWGAAAATLIAGLLAFILQHH